MKKIPILIIGLMILGVSACKKAPNNYYTTPNQTIYDTLNPDRWTTTDGGITYSATVNFVDGDIYQNDLDGVFVYLMFEDNTYEPIPQTYVGFSYSYKVTNQSVTLRIQNSSGSGVISPPGAAIGVKIVTIPSQE